MTRKPYQSDTSDAEWEIIEPLLPAAQRIGVQPGYAQIGTRCKVMLRRCLQMLDFALFQHQFERVTPHDNIP
jgi:transposase